jgi:hypothetical protein
MEVLGSQTAVRRVNVCQQRVTLEVWRRNYPIFGVTALLCFFDFDTVSQGRGCLDKTVLPSGSPDRFEDDS